MTDTCRSATHRGSATRCGWAADLGSATIELAVLAPALLALLGLVIVAGRISVAGSAVEQAAASAARAASLARDSRTAQADAGRAARDSLRDQGITCQPLTSSVDVRGFAVAVGSPSSVTVSIRCAVPLADVAVPGMPGQRTVTAAMTSPIDRFRGRS
ncbi:MAG TPA: TadE/TadG family type IV pilus assembly protein [Motilibacterales bacterium]|nr:TadE/TadG family type IV pilus assembly protein [Motilibacterales bacterium]